MVDIQCPTAEIRPGNKKRRKKKPQDENIYVRILLCRAAVKEEETRGSKYIWPALLNRAAIKRRFMKIF